MKESTLIETTNALFVFAWLFLMNGLTLFVNAEHQTLIVRGQENKFEVFQERPKVTRPSLPKEAYQVKEAIDRLDISYDSYSTEYIGVCFVTAYCPHECGYVEYADGTDNFPRGWITATDTICHYSESNYEPITCAIDPHYFDFGDYLMVDGRVYVAEDTGSAVKGYHIDCFVETMYEVETWNTSYMDVYSVEYEMGKTALHQERKVKRDFINNYLHCRSFGFGIPYRNDIRDFRRFRTVEET